MKRKIVKIHKEKCNGCGLCVSACHEGAIQMIDGKATLVSDIYCDGLGDCLPACPTDAIEIIEREADPFDEVAVEQRMKKIEEQKENKKEESKNETLEPLPCGCPGEESRTLTKGFEPLDSLSDTTQQESTTGDLNSKLQQWPVQLRLINPAAPYLNNADILIAADCTAYAYGNFHNEFIKDRITIIACPKLDDNNYNVEKLTEIFQKNTINSITVVKMSVPCCGGISKAVKKAMLLSETIVKFDEITINPDGQII